MNGRLRGSMALAIAIALMAASGLCSGSSAQPGYPAYITAAGQSPDGLIVKTVLDRVGLRWPFERLAKPEQVADGQTLVIVAGVSAKGLGAAGINIDQEMSRVRAILEDAKKRNAYVIMVHIGGTARRGAQSDQMSRLVAEYSHLMIVVSSGNNDGFFNRLANEHKVTLRIVEDRTEVGAEIAKIMPAR